MNKKALPYANDLVDWLLECSRRFDFEWGDVYWRDDVERWELRHNAEKCICKKPSAPRWVETWGEVLAFIAAHEPA